MNEFKIKEWGLEDVKNKKIWIPHMCDSALVLASVLRNKGFDAEILERSSDSQFELGRRFTDGDQCLPSIMTTNEILKRVFSKDFKKDKEAFFQGKSEGPCRFGRYYMNQEAILQDLGFGDVPVITFASKNAYGGLGKDGKILAWDGMIAQSLIERSLHFTRPYEKIHGISEKIYTDSLNQICEVVEKGISGIKPWKISKILANYHMKNLTELMESASESFFSIQKEKIEKPLIFITGEIYVRTNNLANQDLIKKIEKLGGVALLEPAASFFSYVHEIRHQEHIRNRNLKNNILSNLEIKIMNRDEHNLGKLFESILGKFAYEPTGKTIVQHGKKYLNKRFEGETIVSLGASDYFADKVDGVINTYPFACLPGTLVKSKSAELRKSNNNIPFLNLPYDGHLDHNTEETLGVFMHQIKHKNKL